MQRRIIVGIVVVFVLAGGIIFLTSSSDRVTLESKSFLDMMGESRCVYDEARLRDRERLTSGRSVVGSWNYADKLSVKFIEGSEVRLRNGNLVSLCGEDIDPVYAVLNTYPSFEIRRYMDSKDEVAITREREELEKKSGKILADWNLWYYIDLIDNDDIQTTQKIIDELNDLHIVETAEARPKPSPPPGF